MREIGILMSQPMIIAGLDKVKRQTRRTQGLDKINQFPNDWHIWRSEDGVWQFEHCNGDFLSIKSRYQVGDDLYWKETWWTYSGSGGVHYCATELPPKLSRHFGKVHSSMFMFKKDARIWSTVTKVEAQQLKDITEEDAMAEGMSEKVATYLGFSSTNRHPDDGTYYRNIYKYLWGHLNGTWLPDLWVWKYTMTKPEIKVK